MISIILPTYNEAGNISNLINQISFVLKKMQYEIIVVDDNSPDKTWQIVQNLRKYDKKIRLFRRLHERGLTSAFNFGIQQSQGEIIGWMDADLSMPPKYLTSMIKLIPEYDLVIGSRYVPGGHDQRENKLAVLLSLILNKTAGLFLGHSLTDFTSGYILSKKTVFNNYRLNGDYGEYCIDLLVNSLRKGFKIIEVPYDCVPREHGESKTASNIFGFAKRGKKYLFTIIKLWLKK